jgi:hypothetical protein
VAVEDTIPRDPTDKIARNMEIIPTSNNYFKEAHNYPLLLKALVSSVLTYQKDPALKGLGTLVNLVAYQLPWRKEL